jgi:hypothetical protein
MKKRVERIQRIFKDSFGIELQEKDLYAYLVPRLHKQMDEVLNKEISNIETVQLVDFLSEKLHGKSILTDKKEETTSSSDIKDLEESPQTLITEESFKRVEAEAKKKIKRMKEAQHVK